jgi:hypothetical protein
VAVAHGAGLVVAAGAVSMMPRMTPPERWPLRRDELLITALVPASLASDRPPTPAPLPMLPAPGMPAGATPADLLIDTARLDTSGRLTSSLTENGAVRASPAYTRVGLDILDDEAFTWGIHDG